MGLLTHCPLGWINFPRKSRVSFKYKSTARMSLKHLNGKLKTFLVFLSTIVFDVYVIHCHILIYNYLITGNFKWILEYHPILIPVLVGLCAVAIFIVCAIIGKLRIILFSLIHLDKGFSWISRRLDKCLEWSD